MRRLPIASFFFAAALAAQVPAVAQGLSASDEANARFQTGLKYYDARDFESARLAFTQAYAVLQKPSILLNLALSELYSNHPVEAVGHFEQYIKDPSTSPEKRDKAKKHLEEAMKKTGHLQIRTSADAEVKLDGRPVPPPLSMVHVMPGAHALEARLGGKTKTANVDAKAGENTPVDLAFDAEPASPTPAPVPTTSASTASPPPGSDAHPTEPPPAEPSSPSMARWLVPAGLGVVAVGGLVMGIGFASAHDSSVEDADALLRGGNICADRGSAACREREAKLSDADTQGTLSMVGYVGAAVFGAAAIGTFLFWPRGSSKSGAVVVRPTLGSTTGGSVSISF